LNEVPVNYFAHVEQSVFSNLWNQLFTDKMLQGRLFSYPDAHRYRVGVNAHLLEVNRCPFAVNNYQRDGLWQIQAIIRTNRIIIRTVLMILNRISYKSFEYELDSAHVASYNRNENDDDHYTQPGLLYTKAMNTEDRQNLVNNIVGSMKGITDLKKKIINRQLCHFFRANIELGMKVASQLNVNIDANMMNHSK
jgi:catalase